MHLHNLFFIIGSLITIHASAMEQLPKNNIPTVTVPSLRAITINAIANGYGNNKSEQERSSAAFITVLQKGNNNKQPLVDEYTINACTNEYIRRHCWTADTGNGIHHITTENGILLKKLHYTKAFESDEFIPLLIKNKHAKNSYITGKDNNLCIIDMQSKQIKKELIGHTNTIKCCATTN